MDATALDTYWCTEEFADVKLGDRRLNARFNKTAQLLSGQPMSPINKACDGWTDTKAAYRLFKNEKVTPAKILAPHHDRTVQRIGEQKFVLGVQDSTFLNFDTHKRTEGLGVIGGTKYGGDVLGLVMHSTLAFSPIGEPLGILAQKIFSRTDYPPSKKPKHKAIPIQDKESYRWIEPFDEAIRGLPNNVKLVMVGDREADIYELFTKANDIGAGFLVRADRDRILKTGRKKNEEQLKLWDALAAITSSTRITVDVQSQGTQEARSAIVNIRFTKVTLKPPQRSKAAKQKGGILEPIEIFVVHAIEENPPKDIESLEWVLLTNIPVLNNEDAIERINWYKIRWRIEEFHRILKSGCTVEACRLETADRLKRYLTIMSIVAWRLLWITQINRYEPDLPCTEILSDDEWKALYIRVNRTKIAPEKIPTVRQTVRWIAQLGGFLARKGDKEPGPMTIWRGWQRLNDIVEDYILFAT